MNLDFSDKETRQKMRNCLPLADNEAGVPETQALLDWFEASLKASEERADGLRELLGEAGADLRDCLEQFVDDGKDWNEYGCDHTLSILAAIDVKMDGELLLLESGRAAHDKWLAKDAPEEGQEDATGEER